jgi:hypothetical protein
MNSWLRRAATAIVQRSLVMVSATDLFLRTRWDSVVPPGALRGVTWKPLESGHVDWLAELGPFDSHHASARLARGDRCYTAWWNGRLAHYSWVQRAGAHQITTAGIELPLRGDELWIYNCRTSERARGMRLFPVALARIMDDHIADGFDTAWIYASRGNVASQRAIRRAGFRYLDTLVALRVGARYVPLGRWVTHGAGADTPSRTGRRVRERSTE